MTNEWITPWSMGCSFAPVLGGIKTNLICFSGTLGCAGQSTKGKIILFFLFQYLVIVFFLVLFYFSFKYLFFALDSYIFILLENIFVWAMHKQCFLFSVYFIFFLYHLPILPWVALCFFFQFMVCNILFIMIFFLTSNFINCILKINSFVTETLEYDNYYNFLNKISCNNWVQ